MRIKRITSLTGTKQSMIYANLNVLQNIYIDGLRNLNANYKISILILIHSPQIFRLSLLYYRFKQNRIKKNVVRLLK